MGRAEMRNVLLKLDPENTLTTEMFSIRLSEAKENRTW